MHYPDALAYLESLYPPVVKLGLERIERLLELAEHPERRFPSVLIGGTSGKGSTVAFLAAGLRAAGLRVGTSPKPHLYTPRERLQIDDELISEAEFAAVVAEARPFIEGVAEEEHGRPSFFEALTFLAFLYFTRRRVDRAVMEVGLGGRLDATNVLTPELCVVTTIGLDHTERLGETIPEIAGEKAGIIKPGGRVVTGARGEALPVIERVAAERGAALWAVGREIEVTGTVATASGGRFHLRCPAGELRDLEIGLLGRHQIENAALAAAAALWLREGEPALTDAALRRGLAEARLPGRLETLRRRPDLVIDAAHNPDKAAALAETLRDVLRPAVPGRRIVLVVGVTTAHDYHGMARALAPVAERIIATTNEHRQAVPPEELAEAFRAAGARAVEMAPNAAEAVARALAEARPEDLVCVTGSFFTLAELPPDALAR